MTIQQAFDKREEAYARLVVAGNRAAKTFRQVDGDKVYAALAKYNEANALFESMKNAQA